ncbi:hypothetical protein BH20GEM1_BH20GEM1_10220 [soil metagenome]
MSQLAELLTEAFEEEPRRPADQELGAGIRAAAYWSFAPSLEVVVAESERPPADGHALRAWRTRLDRRPIPLVLLIESNGRSLVVGPAGDPPPVVSLDPRLVSDELASARRLDPLDVRRRLPEAWDRARGAGGLAGLRNVGLFSGHYLRARAPKLSGWEELAGAGRAAARGTSLPARLEALGFEHEKRDEGIYVLRAAGRPAAAVLSYPPGRDLDRASAGGDLPVAGLLKEVDALGARWGILASGDVWRLYSADHPARTTSFAEVDLAKLSDPAYYGAPFSARALAREGLAETIARGSRDFAVGLGDRLRERIYVEVVPRIARAFAEELERREEPPHTRSELAAVYDATLTLLYRLLFVLYAEAREYLPVGASAGYREHSLRKRIDAVIETMEYERDFDPRATDIWSDLQETFDAVAAGHTEWGVPPYNGGLFHGDQSTRAGRILASVRPSNKGLGEALYHLAIDTDEDESGRIDYADLGTRHLGDVYEGLLQFEADRAREDLAYDGARDAYVPGGPDDEIAVAKGGLYLRGRSGGRKASGSYYTPQIVVRHLVDEALVPVLDDHLEAVAALADQGDEEGAARALWSFRVCDPAMGSGHFLVDALDVLTDRIAAFLSERPLKPVRAVLGQLREMVQAQAKDLPAGVLAEIRDVELLKRVVLKRSIYGVDQNPMAVELAKLGLWLDAFVPGLPLSYLDHSLKRGNSLVGVVGDEVREALTPERGTLEGNRIDRDLEAATDRAREAVERVELRLQDIEAARDAERERREALATVTPVFDRWTAESFDLPGARDRIAEEHTLEAADDERQAARIAAEQGFFHWPLEFPEVFATGRRGFDVVLANPPWDKLKVERHDFFQRFIPSLKRIESAEVRERRIAELEEAEADVGERYQLEIKRVEGLKPYFGSGAGNYSLHGGGDPDLFKAFAERFMHLCRTGGAVGCVLPRPLVVGAGSEALRREYFTGWAVQSVDMVWNQRRWVFPGINDRVQSVLLAARKRAPAEPVTIPSAGPLNDAERFARARELRVPYSVKSLRAWSPSLELPTLPTPRAVGVFEKMLAHPRFDSDERSWRALPYRELDSSGDKDLYNERGEGWPVWKGNTFDRYRPDIAPPVYWAEPAPVLERLQRKRLRSRGVFGEFPDELLQDPSSLPPRDCRIVFRDVVRATDRRTMKACLAPPRVFAIHKAPQLVWPRGAERDVIQVLAILNSLPYDWLVRRRVETTMAFGLLNALPVPDAGDSGDRLAALAGRLSCVDDRYAEFAERIGLDEVGPVEDDERAAIEAELDAIVARAYGLSEDDLRVILEDFNEQAVSAVQRERVLECFRLSG